MSLLCMKDICKSFNGIPVLKQVQLTIEKGEVRDTGQEADDPGNTAALYRTRSGD